MRLARLFGWEFVRTTEVGRLRALADDYQRAVEAGYIPGVIAGKTIVEQTIRAPKLG